MKIRAIGLCKQYSEQTSRQPIHRHEAGIAKMVFFLSDVVSALPCYKDQISARVERLTRTLFRLMITPVMLFTSPRTLLGVS